MVLSSDHSALSLLVICIGSCMLQDWLAGLLQPFFCIVPILVLRLVSVAVLWLLCLTLAMLLAVLFIVSPLLIDASMFFTLSSSPCCFISGFSPLACCPSFCVGFSPLAPWLWFLRYFSSSVDSLAVALSLIVSRDTLWYVTISWMPRLHLQHHNYSALRPS